jgi:hypothetical protein
MDKESGVYLTITDNSFQTPGASNMKTLVTMLTTKGKLGLNLVTANDFKDILGYDLKYNSNYYGLGSLLEDVSYAYVWRLNQNAKLANAYFTSTETIKASKADAESFADITELDPKPILAAALKDVGNPQTTAIKFTPVADESTVMNEFPQPSSPQEMVFPDVSETETATYDGKQIKGACIFYNSSDNAPVAVIKENKEGQLTLYKIADGAIEDDVYKTISTNTWTDGTNFYGADTLPMEEPEGEHTTPKNIGEVSIGTYSVTNDVWNVGSTDLNQDVEIIIPSGTAGTAVTLCEGYVATSSDSPLIPGNLYITNDGGSTFAVVTSLSKVYSGIVSTVVGGEIAAKLTDIYTNSRFSNLQYVPYTEDVSTGFYKKIVNTGVTSWYKVEAFTSSTLVTVSYEETNTDIIAALNGATPKEIAFTTYSYEIEVENNSCGIASWNGTELTVIMTKTVSKDSFWNVHTIPSVITDWTVTVASYTNNQYKTMETATISTDTESEYYWKNVTLSNIDLYIQSSIPSNWASPRYYFTLDNGSNGDQSIIASDIDVSILEQCGCNVLATNGITNYKVINKIAQKGEGQFIHTFGDAPAYAKYADLENWMRNVYRSQYLAIGARPDQVEIDEDEYIYVYPSVNYVKILARMYNQYQNLNYPPAGFTYGTISVENLITCDYENYGDELKTNRINWQRTKNRGSVMWEQRTTYSLDTDLSYIAPNFIVDGLREQLIEFEEQFNFRYMSPTDLLNQESGIKSILDDYVTKGFIYKYELEVPTYAEAQKAGRTLTIKIGVALAKDAEVIYININLNNG